MNAKEYLDGLPPLPVWYWQYKEAKSKLDKLMCRHGVHSWKYRYDMRTIFWKPSHQECGVCKKTRGFYEAI